MSTCCLSICWASAHAQRCMRVGTKHELQLGASWATAHAMCMTRTRTIRAACTRRMQAAAVRAHCCMFSFGALAAVQCFAVAQRVLALTSRGNGMNQSCRSAIDAALQPCRREANPMLGCARATACSSDVDSNDALSTHERACTCIVPGVYTIEADATHQRCLPCCETRSHWPRLRTNGTTNLRAASNDVSHLKYCS